MEKKEIRRGPLSRSTSLKTTERKTRDTARRFTVGDAGSLDAETITGWRSTEATQHAE